jgi:hypothetical protein
MSRATQCSWRPRSTIEGGIIQCSGWTRALCDPAACLSCAGWQGQQTDSDRRPAACETAVHGVSYAQVRNWNNRAGGRPWIRIRDLGDARFRLAEPSRWERFERHAASRYGLSRLRVAFFKEIGYSLAYSPTPDHRRRALLRWYQPGAEDGL